MDRPHIITLSGKPGSGKSSTADRVAELLSYTRYSAGDFVRATLQKKKMSLKDFNQQALSDNTIDTIIDAYLRKLRDQHDIVIDSRLGFYWIPESFKVYLDLDVDVATARIFKDQISNARRSVERSTATSINDVQKQVQTRINTEVRRFKALYGVNPYDTSHYDLVINTARHSPQTVALHIFDMYKKWQLADSWVSKHTSVPMGYSYEDDFAD